MYLTNKEANKWLIDIETDGLNPTRIWCVVVKNLVSKEVRTFLEREEFIEWYKPEYVLIGHNIISYDIPVLNRLFSAGISTDRCIDTLVLSYLYNPGIVDGHSLEAWGRRLGCPKGQHSEWDCFSPEMLQYCKQDVNVTEKLYLAISDRMLQYGVTELACEIEHKIRVILDEQERNGFWVDRQRAKSFRDELRSRQSDLTEQIQKLFPSRRTEIARRTLRRTKDGSFTAQYGKDVSKYDHIEVIGDEYICYLDVPFNIGSPLQRVDRLLELGWKPTKFTKTKSEKYPEGFPQVDEEALLRFATESGRSEVSSMAEWLVIQGRSSMLDTWLANLGTDSRIHGKVLTCGATTRRMIHSAPNTANIPSGSKAKYGHECRALWGVEPSKGLVLVGYDAAGLETAGLCHYLANPAATEVLLRPKPFDVHTVNATRLTEALGWPCDREWVAKTCWYAWLYGAYPKKLGSISGALKNGMSEEAAGDIIVDTFFRNVPGLKELTNDVQLEWRGNAGRLRCIDGGYVRCHSLSAALNYKIQSMGAIVMKMATILLTEELDKLGIYYKKIGDIHDEGQIETRFEYGDLVGSAAVSSITRAGNRLGCRVALSGDYKIGQSWNETH